MGSNTSQPPDLSSQIHKNSDLVVRDHTFDYDLTGIEYLKAHQIPELFQDVTERLLSERPWDSLRFIRNILIHKVIQHQDNTHRRSNSPRSSPKKEHKLPNQCSDDRKRHSDLPESTSYPSFSSNHTTSNPLDLTRSAKLQPLKLTSCNVNFDDYDADKLLESRTSVDKQRTRSYSDSAILYVAPKNKINQKSRNESQTQNVSEDLHTINVNQLSQPITIDMKPNVVTITPRNKQQTKNQKKDTPKTNIIETISSVMDDMNIDKKHKNSMLEHLKQQQQNIQFVDEDSNDDGIDHLYIENTKEMDDILHDEEKEEKQEQIQLNGKKRKSRPFESIGNIAKKFENQLKSLSNTAKAIPSQLLKLKDHASADNVIKDIDDIDHADNDNNNDHEKGISFMNEYQPSATSSSTANVTKSNEEIISTSDQLKEITEIAASAQPLRRSRTLDLISYTTNHSSQSPLRHILSLSQRPCFGFDIGGSLTKISFFEPTSSSRWNVNDTIKAKFVKSATKYGTSGVRDKSLSFPWRNGTFHFIHFQTHRMKEAVSLFKMENLLSKNEIFYATGGGAHKYSSMLHNKLSVRVRKGDELKCLISGLNFLLTHVSDECYYLSDPASKRPSPKIPYNIKNEGSVFPYLLVNVGSGVSILKVDSATQFERVSGSQLGGGTYWGLCRLCEHAVNDDKYVNDDKLKEEKLTFKKAFELAIKGNAKNVNMLVSDIYGGDYPQCNLPGDLVASAFGKCISIKDPPQMGDIARGLLDMIAMNVAQIAYLNAMRFKTTRIIFAGNFLRQNDLSMAMISYAIHYWSQGVMKACFLKHEGYFGSIGVMLLPDKELIDDDDDDENKQEEQKNNNDENNKNMNTIQEH